MKSLRRILRQVVLINTAYATGQLARHSLEYNFERTGTAMYYRGNQREIMNWMLHSIGAFTGIMTYVLGNHYRPSRLGPLRPVATVLGVTWVGAVHGDNAGILQALSKYDWPTDEAERERLENHARTGMVAGATAGFLGSIIWLRRGRS